MLDIDWDEVPEEYYWVAQDECGLMYAYSERPCIVEAHGRWIAGGSCEHVGFLENNRNWRNSLTERPE